MEFVDGWSLQTFIDKKHQESPESREACQVIARTIIAFLLETAHLQGRFHADPHTSNIIISREGEVAFVDFGIVGTLIEPDNTRIMQYLRLLVQGDIRSSCTKLLELCEVPPDCDREQIEMDYLEITDIFKNPDLCMGRYFAYQQEQGSVFIRIIYLLQSHHIQIPTNLLLYMKAFNAAEGSIHALQPLFSLKEIEIILRQVGYYHAYKCVIKKHKQAAYALHKPSHLLDYIENLCM